MSYNLTAEQVQSYNKDGYVFIKNFCSPQEINKLYNVAVEDDAMKKRHWI